ncbi:hypothetical protein HMF8227_02260 [Saliniradius amylolyticus]|uniref:Serine aminopeptidase S33 domain-containing protein n=1 Tax=Saliniradius amylolyticus TaxID=2183582 RepID=A0A2S2E501_9ALTE|nr:alpha/beta hydrolase [Saliniradius amylolyticus]AWL12713.1 hypothetical protein HMF8227_02260 [Saliniradius amylolyticus]
MLRLVAITVFTLSLPMDLCAKTMTTSQFIVQSNEVVLLDIDTINTSLKKQGAEGKAHSVSVDRVNGAKLRGLRFESDNAQREILFYPGNGMSLERAHGLLRALAALNANVTWFDPRGLGASDAIHPITVENLKADALRVFDAARKAFSADLPVVIYGVSVGTSLASYVAAHRNVEGLVLEGAYVSVSELMANLAHVGLDGDPSHELSQLTPAPALKRFEGPLLLLVGSQDDVTPASFASRLLTIAASNYKQQAVITAAPHAMALTRPSVLDHLMPFLNRLSGK